jgi:hypothetical protein
MKKTQAPAAAEKAATQPELKKPESEKPYIMVDAPTPGRPIMSSALKTELDPPGPREPRRGPTSADNALDARSFVSTHATAAEFKEFAAAVRARMAKDPTSWRWERCSRCGLVMKAKPTSAENAACFKCNFRGAASPAGHFRTMTDAEVDSYLFEKAIEDKAAEERLARANLNATNASRGKEGLPPLSFPEFQKQRKAEFERTLQRSQAIGEVGALYRRKS